jgi:Domain of unknown function DUF29
MSDIYDDDVLLWSERQAALLRRVAAGGRINAADLDWPNIIEEIESVGQSQVDQVELWLFQMSLHLLKAEAWPLSGAVPHWQGEARTFRVQARRKYRASMAQKLDVPGLYADALQALPDTIDGTPPLPLPDVCPWTLDELLSEG